MQWDAKVSNDVQQSWNKQKRKFKQIEQLHVQILLNFHQLDFITFLMHLNLVVGSLSTSGLLARRKGKTHFCSLLGKARAVPKRFVSIPSWS